MSKTSEIHMPPQNLDAEKAFIGSLMLGPNYLDEVVMNPDDLYSLPAQTVYVTLQQMWAAGNRGIDVVTLAQELIRVGKFESVGGASYLTDILETVPHAAHVNYYANIVRECARKRRIIGACTDAMKYAYEGGAATSAEIIEKLDQTIQSLIDGSNGKTFASMSEAVDELEQMEKNPSEGISTGLRTVDNYLKHGGFTPGQLVVAAGRPGGGKSVLLGQIAKCAAQNNGHALIVSLEMAKYELAERYTETIDRTTLRGLPIHFTETAFSIDSIRQAIRASVRRYGTKVAVVDYLQLVGVHDTRKNRDQQIGEVTRGLKLLAKEVKIPIVVGCQLNRGSEKEERLPRLTDLRESGSIEQDADIVILLHHEDGGADSKIMIAKQRGGMTGNVPVVFDRRRSEFRDLDPAKGFFGS